MQVERPMVAGASQGLLRGCFVVDMLREALEIMDSSRGGSITGY
jgi:hypothetical protein